MNLKPIGYALTLILLASTAAIAQNERAALRLELNNAQPVEAGCRLTFVATNDLGIDLERAAYEVALFDGDGLVERLTVLDFKALPEGQTKVRQFDLPDLDCTGLGRVLINGTTACEGTDADACMRQLETTTRGSVAFGT